MRRDFPRRAAMYLRVSLDATGEHLAVDRQRADCLRIIRERGWTLTQEYVDNSVSASKRTVRRPSYDRMVQDYDAGLFDALVCWDLDRLTRQPRQLEDWIERAEERGLVITTANGEADLSTDGGRMYARIKASVARSEVERKSARQKAANAQRARMGRPPLGTRLMGYTAKGELVPEEAKVVRSIFNDFLAGESLKGIARGLQEAGVPTRHGGRWNPSSIRTILLNERYGGIMEYMGEVLPNVPITWEPIVSEDTFFLAQSKLSDPRRKTAKEGTDRKHLGSSLFRCAECGHGMYGYANIRYRCPHCLFTRSRSHIDAYVLAVVRARLAQPDVADLLAVDHEPEVKELTAQIQRLRDRLERVNQDYDEGIIDGLRYRTAAERVRAELTATEGKRAALSGGLSGTTSVLGAPDPVEAFDSASLMVRRRVIDALLDVRLKPGKRGCKTFDPDSVILTWKEA